MLTKVSGTCQRTKNKKIQQENTSRFCFAIQLAGYQTSIIRKMRKNINSTKNLKQFNIMYEHWEF
jgi:hypothetical protein